LTCVSTPLPLPLTGFRASLLFRQTDYVISLKQLQQAKQKLEEATADLQWFDDFVAGRVPPAAPARPPSTSVLEQLQALASLDPHGVIPQVQPSPAGGLAGV
jgi:hypothetical protein